MERKLKPETLMMSFGYKPVLSEGALKCPIFQTSTFVFKSAEDGKRFFEMIHGQDKKQQTEEMGLIYTRINNPDIEILEDRIALWDGGEDCAVFESGMAAITTSLLEYLRTGDAILASSPIYGGTNHFMREILPNYGIETKYFSHEQNEQDILHSLETSGTMNKVKVIFIETPANPTNSLIDIAMCRSIANAITKKTKNEVVLMVDNTYLGPLWQHPLKHGADLVLYSATKYIGGHSDVVAGAVVGSKEMIKRIKTLRLFLGNMVGPWDGWLLLRSLETLKIRMEQQTKNAEQLAAFLTSHPKVEKVHYLSLLKEDRQRDIYKRQCLSPGAMLSFDIIGGEKEAFIFLNHLKVVHLAVSLGGTETLAQHPNTMTHADVPSDEKEKHGITGKMIRISVGIEAIEDLIEDVRQAFDAL